MAPVDIKFQPAATVSDSRRAFVSFYGSWNRAVPVGYKLSYVAFSPQTGEPTEPQDSVTAEVDVLTSPNLSVCPNGGCFRPTGLAFHPDGQRLFLSSVDTGEIWVVAPDRPA